MYNIEVCGDGENHRMLDSLDHQKAHNWRIILARLCYVQSTSFFLWRSHLLANVHQPPRTPRGKRNVFGAFVANLKGYHLFMFKNFKSVVCYWIQVPQVRLCLNVWNFAFCLICALNNAWRVPKLAEYAHLSEPNKLLGQLIFLSCMK